MSRAKKGFSWVRLLTWLIGIGIVGVLIVAGVTMAILSDYIKNAPSVEDVRVKHALPTVVYDRNNEIITKFLVENREIRKLGDMPQYLKDAFIAIEDHTFYTHKGINITRILGALVYDITNRTTAQGGSTITVQLARNVFLSHEKTLDRKIWEVFYAFQLERRYTKDEILEFYMNAIYFGHGTYGVEAASQLFFGKSVEKLSLAEAALIAGVPKGWLVYSPYRNIENSISRRNLVLEQMLKYGYITKEQEESAKKEEVKLIGLSKSAQTASYAAFMIRDYLLEKYGSDTVYKGGLTVKTTLDKKYQAIAEEELKAKVPKGRTETKDQVTMTYPQYALVSLDPRTGEILALVGGRGEDEFNRATKATRSPGSTFKPFVYIGALEMGFTPASVLEDKPLEYVQPDKSVWAPKNFNNKFIGPIRLREALAQSTNMIAIQLLEKVTPQRAIEIARKMGISTLVTSGSRNDIGLSITLGGLTKGIIPLELCSAYGVLATNGVKAKPYFIREIVSAEGVVLEKGNVQKEVVLDEKISYMMTNMLTSVINSPTGTGRRGYLGRPAAGKTGTGDSNTDAWFVGYTPDMVTAVWIGEDSMKEMNYKGIGAVGSSTAVLAWAGYMKRALADRPALNFTVPGGISTGVKICADSGLLPSSDCPSDKIISETFIKGTEPKARCTIHSKAEVLSMERVCTVSGMLADEGCPDESVALFRFVWIGDKLYEANEDGSANLGKPVSTEKCTLH
ncbi:MAG TPA: PBP1A family penicillin-binding protein [Bacillota bacterium]|nr:PBP1A family penicillin-binding protein [Bacillota bacterium]